MCIVRKSWCKPFLLIPLSLLLASCSAENADVASPAPDPVADTAAAPQAPRTFGNVTRERLLNADSEPEQWMIEGRDFGKSHFPLDQISPDNVDRLGLAWDYKTDTHRGMEANPIFGARRYRGMPQWDDVLDDAQADAIHAYLIDLAWQTYTAQRNNETLETASADTMGH